jgi:hypothetical protein
MLLGAWAAQQLHVETPMLSITILPPDCPVSGELLVKAWLLGEILSAGCDLFDSRVLVAGKQDSHLYRSRSESSNAGNYVGSMNQG